MTNINRAKGLLHCAVTRWKLGAPPRSRKVAHNAKISGDVIGDYTYVGGRSEIRAVLTRVSIGRYCSIGRDVKIFSAGQSHRFDGLSTYPFYLLDKRIRRQDFNTSGPDTVIGNDVWIGSNAVIQAGVCIGDGAVVGSSSVVTRDVEPFTIVTGVPARKFARRFDSQTAAWVAGSRWWELDDPDLAAHGGEALIRNAPVAAQDAPW